MTPRKPIADTGLAAEIEKVEAATLRSVESGNHSHAAMAARRHLVNDHELNKAFPVAEMPDKPENENEKES